MHDADWLKILLGTLATIAVGAVGGLWMRVWAMGQKLAEKADALSVQGLLSPMNREIRELGNRLEREQRRRGELVGRAEGDKLWERVEAQDRARADDRVQQASLAEQVRSVERRIEELAPDVKASVQAANATAAAVEELIRELRKR